MSEKFRRQDAVDKAKALPFGGGRTHRRHEIPKPKVGDVKRRPDSFRSPFATHSTAPAIVGEGHHAHSGVPRLAGLRMRDAGSVGPSYSKALHHAQDIAHISATDSTDCANGAGRTTGVVTHKVTPMWEQDYARFSFEHRHDLNSPPNNSMEGERSLNILSTEHSPSRTARGSQETVVSMSNQHYRDHTDDLPDASTHGDARWPSTETDNAAVQYCLDGLGTPVRNHYNKPAPTHQESSYSRQATIGCPPSRSSHRLDSQSATSAARQEIMQRQQAETDASIAARVAATLALADGQRGSDRKE